MGLLDKIKQLASERSVTIAEIERATGISNGQIRRWDTSSPKAENLAKVADYFGVSTDYLLGRDSKNRTSSQAELIAAHIDNGVSDEEMTQIINFIEFTKKNNKK